MLANKLIFENYDHVEELIYACLAARCGSFVRIEELCVIAFGIFAPQADAGSMRKIIRGIVQKPASKGRAQIVCNEDMTAFRIDAA